MLKTFSKWSQLSHKTHLNVKHVVGQRHSIEIDVVKKTRKTIKAPKKNDLQRVVLWLETLFYLRNTAMWFSTTRRKRKL